MSDKIYDLSQLNELSGGDKSFTKSMIQTFLEHTPGQLEEMKAAYSNGDMLSMGALAHKIKPNIDLFGISDIMQDIRELEKRGKANDNAPEVKDILQKVDDILKEAFKQLNDY